MAAPTLTATEAFLQSFIHQDYYCLGRKLLPFSLRHWLLLAAMKHPLTHGGVWTDEDLRLAVLVLSTKSNAAFFSAGRFRSIYWKVWKAFASRLPLAPNKAVIHEYLDDYFPNFPFWVSGSSAPDRVPGFLVAASRLLSACTPDQIMNMPLGEVLAWNLAKNETEPVLEPNANLMSDYDVEVLKRPEFAEAV